MQVISIVTAGGANGTGLFYPNGLNGAINGSSASAAELSTDIAGRRKLLVSVLSTRPALTLSCTCMCCHSPRSLIATRAPHAACVVSSY